MPELIQANFTNVFRTDLQVHDASASSHFYACPSDRLAFDGVLTTKSNTQTGSQASRARTSKTQPQTALLATTARTSGSISEQYVYLEEF